MSGLDPTIPNCPVASCTLDQPCSACLAEELVRRSQDQQLATLLKKRGKGRPSKPKDELLVSLHVSVHPGFLDCLPAKGRGMAIERAFGFTRPATGQMEKEKA